jgi:YD repeat-containing protein
VTDPKGQQTVMEYDALDRVKAVGYDQTSGVGPRHYDYGYDPEGNLTRVNEAALLSGTTPQTRSYTRSYDARNRLTAATDPN